MDHSLPFVGQTQNDLLHVLLRAEHALALGEIATRLNVTKTAARQHILTLQRGGFVQNTQTDKRGQGRRGRPGNIYELSPRGRELFSRHYALFSNKLIGLLEKSMSQKKFEKIMVALGASLAEDFRHKMPPANTGKTKNKAISPSVLEQLAALMRDLGYDAYVNGPDEVVARNCVFHQLAAQNQYVCEVDLTLAHKLTGKRPAHSACMVRGDKVCRFKF